MMLQDYLNLMIETNFSICKIKRFKLKPLNNQKQIVKGKGKEKNKNKIERDRK